jgi:NAD(P)-dependent dehydrogenase (short-subunit alcohol dehydrogenase family)
MKLDGKIALVTGGSRGIGRAIARRLAAEGAKVALTHAGNAAAGAEAVALIEKAGGTAHAFACNIARPGDIAALFEALGPVLGRWAGGAARLDILVNNAGVGAFLPILSTPEAALDEVWDTNVKGTVLVTQKAAPLIADGGRVITISSGLSKRPSSAIGAYSMSKAALDAFTVLVAQELGPRRITANTVAPGWTATEINAEARANPDLAADVMARTTLGRFGEPEDIAAVVAFLASADGGWVTGQYVEASGGFDIGR